MEACVNACHLKFSCKNLRKAAHGKTAVLQERVSSRAVSRVNVLCGPRSSDPDAQLGSYLAAEKIPRKLAEELSRSRSILRNCSRSELHCARMLSLVSVFFSNKVSRPAPFSGVMHREVWGASDSEDAGGIQHSMGLRLPDQDRRVWPSRDRADLRDQAAEAP